MRTDRVLSPLITQDHGADGPGPESSHLPPLQLGSCQLAHFAEELLDAAAVFAVESQDEAALLFIISQPFCHAVRISQIGFIQDDQGRLLPDELCDHGIGTAHGNPGIDQFDDDIDDLQIVFDEMAGLGHMAGKPVYNHMYYHLSVFYSTGIRKGRQTKSLRMICGAFKKNRTRFYSGSCFFLVYPVVSISLCVFPLIHVRGQ